MTEPKDPRIGVKSEKIVFHEADGTPTDDKDKAASAEITTIFEDGHQEVTLMGRGPLN